MTLCILLASVEAHPALADHRTDILRPARTRASTLLSDGRFSDSGRWDSVCDQAGKVAASAPCSQDRRTRKNDRF